MNKKEETQEFMLKLADARINKLVDKNKELEGEVEWLTESLAEERAVVKALQDHVNEIDDFEIIYLDAMDKRKKH